MNKKGFTLVELVIVIAVIAILAAVLLPTFATVIENARISAATQVANNAIKDYYTRVAGISYSDSIDTIADLKDYVVIVENGTGAVDYMFTVSAGGVLNAPTKVDHTMANTQTTLFEGTLITANVDASGMINGCYIYSTPTSKTLTA